MKNVKSSGSNFDPEYFKSTLAIFLKVSNIYLTREIHYMGCRWHFTLLEIHLLFQIWEMSSEAHRIYFSSQIWIGNLQKYCWCTFKILWMQIWAGRFHNFHQKTLQGGALQVFWWKTWNRPTQICIPSILKVHQQYFWTFLINIRLGKSIFWTAGDILQCWNLQ